MLAAYLQRLFDCARCGDAREESYYPALAELLAAYAHKAGMANVCVTTLPKKTAGGNPDFRVWDGALHIVGYLEAKSPSVEQLDPIETTEQMQRYLGAFPNVILTNYYEFRLYRGGVLIDRVQIARPFGVRLLKTPPPVEHEAEFFNLLAQFFSFSFPVVRDAAALARHLALRTRFLNDVIAGELADDAARGKGHILSFFNAFKEYLLHKLNEADFADLYAQTVTYGLFAARTRAKNGFSRTRAFDCIPHTIGILRDVFRFISLGELSPQMAWIVDDISEVLAVTDVKAILHQYFTEHKGADPIVHFYETFLAAYDPATRERRGVYYTPEPVVAYTDRSLHALLKEVFNKPDGLADRSVIILDFAGGTQTYNAMAAHIAVDEFVATHGAGARAAFIQEHILEHFYAFELMMAPYAIGHIKMAFLLEELGYTLTDKDRFKFYLTNTLELAELQESSLPGLSALSEEAHLAAQVKNETPVLVIHGNPPYSGISANMNDWIVNLLKETTEGLQSYYEVDGAPLREKKVWLQDDYVKFIRFAQWKIQQRGEGIVGIITNHGYLDNPTFRGMRQSLLRTFDQVCILDLHGNAKKKEVCPDGAKDENVFDIQQGVCIAIMIKRGTDDKDRRVTDAMVQYAETWGTRAHKYTWLNHHTVATTKWRTLKPTSPFYFFIPRNETGRKEYENLPALTDIFPVNVTGIVTAHDRLLIDFDRASLKSRIMMLRNKALSDDDLRRGLSLKENYQWRLADARHCLMADDQWDHAFDMIQYRPFDTRHIFYHNAVVWRPRRDVMRHMLQPNFGLMACRQQNKKGFCHAFVTDHIVESCLVSNQTREIGYLFPLYLYETPSVKPTKKLAALTQALMLLEPEAPYPVAQGKQVNVAPDFWRTCQEHYGKKLAPESLLGYIYAVLYSTVYREKYVEFLKIDFPRVPFTTDAHVFAKVARLGETLIAVHLLKEKERRPTAVRFQGQGDARVTSVRYDAPAGRIYINATQYFENVAPDVWIYQIGGYQVCAKWLKDRKNSTLALDDLAHYAQIIVALRRTIDVQSDIDAVFPEIEKATVTFNLPKL